MLLSSIKLNLQFQLLKLEPFRRGYENDIKGKKVHKWWVLTLSEHKGKLTYIIYLQMTNELEATNQRPAVKIEEKKRYDTIYFWKRVKLLHMVVFDGYKCGQACQQLNIKLTTGCLMIRIFKKCKKILNKRGGQEEPLPEKLRQLKEISLTQLRRRNIGCPRKLLKKRKGRKTRGKAQPRKKVIIQSFALNEHLVKKEENEEATLPKVSSTQEKNIQIVKIEEKVHQDQVQSIKKVETEIKEKEDLQVKQEEDAQVQNWQEEFPHQYVFSPYNPINYPVYLWNWPMLYYRPPM